MTAPHDTANPAWLAELDAARQQRESQHAQRTLTPTDADGRFAVRDGQRLLNLAGNDYLGLSQHPALVRAARDAIKTHGTGGAASRLVTGTLPPHAQLEERFAKFKHAEAALLFPTGFMANLGVLTALAGPSDVILQDKLNHASLIDAARFSGATIRTFPHRGYDKLERLLHNSPPPGRGRGRVPDGETIAEALKEHEHNQARSPRTFIVTDAVFSMDGTVADLPRLVELARIHHAILVVDEAHATGILGSHGTGLAEQQGVAGDIDITVSTASKALGSLGGIVTGPREVVDELTNTARSFIYTTALPPSIPASIGAALDVIRDEPQRRQRLGEIIRDVRTHLHHHGWDINPDDPTPIIPLIVGDNAAALELAARLQNAGILTVGIRPPTVAPGSARVRLSLRCDLTDEEVSTLCDLCSR